MTDARSWLGRARAIEKEIDSYRKAMEETRDRLEKTTQSFSQVMAQSSKDPHKFDKLVELEDMIIRKIEELVETQAEIVAVIGKLQDGRQRTVLLDYYVRRKSLEETAVHMGYSYANIKKIRAKAICGVAAVLDKNCSLK